MKRLLLILFIALNLVGGTPTYVFAQRPHQSKKKHYKKEATVYVTRTGGKYHAAGCSYLRYSSFAMKKSDAIAEGYTACSRCY